MAPPPVPRQRTPAAVAAAMPYTTMVVAFTVSMALLATCAMVRPAAGTGPAFTDVPGANGDPQTTTSRKKRDAAAVMKGQGDKAADNDTSNNNGGYDRGVSGRRLHRPGKSGGGSGSSDGAGVLTAAAKAAAAAAAAAIDTQATAWETNPVGRLIESTGSSGNVFHLDLTLLEHGDDGVGDPAENGRHSSSSENIRRNGSNASSSPQGSSTWSQQKQQQQQPWFEGFTVAAAEADPEAGPAAVEASVMTAAVTIGHPIRRLLSYFVEEGVDLEETLSWMDGQGVPADPTTRYRRGYQLVDNYFVRVLGGRAAWELPPGGVGSTELTAARIALGKFEVMLRQDCLSTDLALLTPYLNSDNNGSSGAYMDSPSIRSGCTVRNSAPDNGPSERASPPTAIDPDQEEEEKEEEPPFLSLPAGPEGERLVRANRWDLQLWGFANELVASRSSTLAGFRCGSSKLAKKQRILGEGRRAVVFNSPDFHLTGVSMFSCALVANGYHVTVVLRTPVVGYQQLLPCPDAIITLRDPPTVVTDSNNSSNSGSNSTSANSTSTVSTPLYDRNPVVLSDTVAGMLGLSTATTQDEGQQRQPRESGRVGDIIVDVGEASDKSGGKVEVEVAGGGEAREEQGGAGGSGGGANFFDVSVMCTAFVDLNALFDTVHNGMDPRLAEALLWNVNTTIWNVHGVGRAFGNGSVPPAAHDFAARLPSRERETRGKTPPPTFLTVYGQHVRRWEQSLEEAYEGWGGGLSHDLTAPQNNTFRRPKVTNLRGLFPHSGVVYPIVPTGHLKLPRPSWQYGGDGVGSGLFNIVAPFSSSASFSSSDPSLSSLSPDPPQGPGRGEGADGHERTKKRVHFVIQGNMQGVRRNYLGLFGCLEQMCTSTDEGRDNFSLKAVGSRGDMTAVLEAHPCAASHYTEDRDLEYKDFYAKIVEGDFVVTAAAGHDYEFDHATSSVPTSLLLEKPLVMSSSLLNAYPCLRNSRIHSMVANDDLCLNLQAAYDLTPREYDEMELEARDCKLQMWRQTQKTVVDIVREGRIKNGGG